MVDYTAEVEQIYATLSDQPPHSEEQIAKIKTTIELYLATFKYYDYARTRELVDKSYKQHSQLAGDGLDSIIEASKVLKSIAAKKWIFSERWPGDTGEHVFDLYRLKNGKFVEHWDVIQEIKPENIKHGNSVF